MSNSQLYVFTELNVQNVSRQHSQSLSHAYRWSMDVYCSIHLEGTIANYCADGIWPSIALKRIEFPKRYLSNRNTRWWFSSQIKLTINLWQCTDSSG